MAIANTNATNKTQVTPDFPDSQNGVVEATLQSHIAISGVEVFQGADVQTGQVYQCTLDANGNADATAHPTGWFLPTPDATGTLAWVYRFTVTDAAGNVRFMARTAVSYSASAQSLAAILAAGSSSETADAITGLLSSKVDKAGDTMTGQLNFTGTDHAGIKLVSLTTAERDALTPAEGMVIYNDTTNQVQVYQGGTWVSVGAAATPSLDDITDVTITGPVADKELLARDDVSGLWINQTAAEVGVATSGHNHTGTYDPAGSAATVQGNLDTHTGDQTNPHAVTAGQVGADVVGAAAAAQSAAQSYADSAVSTHEADTSVHGIANTALLLDTADIGSTVASQSHTHTENETIIIACSDETTALTAGTAKVTFRMPYAMTLTAVPRASVTTAPTGSTLIVDINEGGVSILSTKLSIDATEKTSTTAAVPAVVSDTALADDAEITIDIDQVGSSESGKGLKVTLIGTRP